MSQVLGGLFKKDNCGCPCRDYYVAKCQAIFMIIIIIIVINIHHCMKTLAAPTSPDLENIVVIIGTTKMIIFGRLNMLSTVTRTAMTQSVKIEQLECPGR